MELDLGFAGLGLLVIFSVGFGLVAQLVRTSSTRWVGPVAAIGWFAGGLFASEVVFGRATVDEIQPIIDGLAFDEALLGGLIAGALVVVGARVLGGGRAADRPRAA